MVIPPCYADLGKGARDLFGRGFNYGQLKLDTKTKTGNGIEFNTSGSSTIETGKIAGSLESKYKWSQYGLTFSEKWTTDNVIATTLTLEDQIAKGLKLSFDTSFAPDTGKKSGKIKSAFKREYIHLNCDVDFDFAGPTVHGAGVAWYAGFMAGYQMSFDTSKSKLTKNNFAIGFDGQDYALHASVVDSNEFQGSVHQRIGDNVETGVNFSWSSGTNTTKFGIAGKYDYDKDSSVRVKINNQAQLGLSYTQNLKHGVKLTVSALVESLNINAGGHKLGLGLEFND